MQVMTFFTAKGGTGKTTFNMLLASYLKYQLGKRVALLDFDNPEYNLTFCRRRELEFLRSRDGEVDERQFYPILTVQDITPANLEKTARQVLGLAADFDYLVMDFKGSLQAGDPVSVMAEYGILNKVAIPVELDPMIIASMKSLALTFRDNGQQALLFFNRVHGKERPEQYEAVRKWFTEKGCTVARSQVKSFIGMKREQGEGCFVRSTLSFEEKTIRKVNPGIVELFNELLDYG